MFGSTEIENFVKDNWKLCDLNVKQYFHARR